MKEHQLIQSYVSEKFFISTAYRRCSAVLASDFWYYETIVWEWDAKTKKRGSILEIDDSGHSRIIALCNHANLCSEYCLKNSNQQALVSGSSKVKTSANPNPGNVSPPRPVKHD